MSKRDLQLCAFLQGQPHSFSVNATLNNNNYGNAKIVVLTYYPGLCKTKCIGLGHMILAVSYSEHSSLGIHLMVNAWGC